MVKATSLVLYIVHVHVHGDGSLYECPVHVHVHVCMHFLSRLLVTGCTAHYMKLISCQVALVVLY